MKDAGMDYWCIVNCDIPIKVLNELYDKFMKDGIPPIENLTPEEKTKYWNVAKKYHTDQVTAIKASKAAYILSLITSNE